MTNSVCVYIYICTHVFFHVLNSAFDVVISGGKKKANPFPDLEGEESASDFVSKYKKQCLLKKTQYRELQEKFDAEKPLTGKTLALRQ